MLRPGFQRIARSMGFEFTDLQLEVSDKIHDFYLIDDYRTIDSIYRNYVKKHARRYEITTA